MAICPVVSHMCPSSWVMPGSGGVPGGGGVMVTSWVWCCASGGVQVLKGQSVGVVAAVAEDAAVVGVFVAVGGVVVCMSLYTAQASRSVYWYMIACCRMSLQGTVTGGSVSVVGGIRREWGIRLDCPHLRGALGVLDGGVWVCPVGCWGFVVVVVVVLVCVGCAGCGDCVVVVVVVPVASCCCGGGGCTSVLEALGVSRWCGGKAW